MSLTLSLASREFATLVLNHLESPLPLSDPVAKPWDTGVCLRPTRLESTMAQRMTLAPCAWESLEMGYACRFPAPFPLLARADSLRVHFSKHPSDV